jgi:hypothetical protein
MRAEYLLARMAKLPGALSFVDAALVVAKDHVHHPVQTVPHAQ